MIASLESDMCDTIVVVPPRAGSVVLAKNSDREPGEAQLVEHLPRARRSATRATWIELDGGDAHEIAISRPAWMWGAEMGVNEHGLAIGNEALFTRVAVPERGGLTGMDLLRLALERARDAPDALERIAWLLARHGQGGGCGYRDRSFRYSSAFVIADPREAWLMETAGPYWVALRVRGARTASNVLSIGREIDRVGPGTIEEAWRRGWARRGEDFDFARAFADPVYAHLTGGDRRRACTARAVARGSIDTPALIEALRDHGGHAPHARIRLAMPCAHASFWPTRWHGQTTGSMVVELTGRGAPAPLFTGTSSPCLSVFKRVPLGSTPIDTGPMPPAEGADRESLFWRHERLHRAVLRSYPARRAIVEPDRAALEARALAGEDVWAEHRERVVEWAERAARGPVARPRLLFDAYWARQSRLDHLELA